MLQSLMLLTLSAQYAEQGLCNGLVSVRLPIPLIDRKSGVRRVCYWVPRGQEISIDSGGRPAAANADSVTLTATVAG